MLEFYDSNSANRTINTYLDFAGSERMENKELLVLSIISYLGKTTCFYLSRVLGVSPHIQVNSLAAKGYIKVEKQGRENHVEINYTPVSAKVYSDKIMYVFMNALFNIGKYTSDYNISSWNVLASIVELPLNIKNNGYVDYEYDLLKCIGGNKTNRSYNRVKLVKMGVIKRVGGSSQAHTYRLNQNAYLLGSSK